MLNRGFAWTAPHDKSVNGRLVSTGSGYTHHVFVWQWFQQHRLLSVLVLAFIIVSAAGGTAWALVFRTVASPVGLREALRIYRKEQSAKVLASLRARLPAPGVYSYRTTGGESLSMMGVQRSFPAETSMIVADGQCATVSWVPITQHTETTTVCPTPGGALTLPRFATYEAIAGTTTTSTVACPSTAYLLPAGVQPGTRWTATCSLESPAEKVLLTGVAIGPTTLTVDGSELSVDHVRITLNFNGSESGTNPTDYWVVPSTGLIVREHEQVDAAQGSVRYDESMDAALSSLTPAR